MDDDGWPEDGTGTRPPPVKETPLPKKEMFVTACIFLSEVPPLMPSTLLLCIYLLVNCS
jgi:hypothetical protein